MSRQGGKCAVEKVPGFFSETKCEPGIFVILLIKMSSSRATVTS